MCASLNVVPLQELKEGRQIGRAELYIATHTRKNGLPIDDYSGIKIVCPFLMHGSLLVQYTFIFVCTSFLMKSYNFFRMKSSKNFKNILLWFPRRPMIMIFSQHCSLRRGMEEGVA